MPAEPAYYVKVIRITAEDSPNVRLALLEKRKGLPVSHRELVPGLLSYAAYCERRKNWDPIRQCIGLDARFYKGAEILLFPPTWLDRAEQLHREWRGRSRTAEAMGVDPGEGEADSAWVVIDRYGVLEIVSYKTPNTKVISRQTKDLIAKWKLPCHKVLFDRGGGGLQHADYLRGEGYEVQTCGFGEGITMEPVRRLRFVSEKVQNREEKYAYFNRRSEMYGELSLVLDPDWGIQRDEDGVLIGGPNGFAIPANYYLLRSELAPIPKTYDGEGRFKLLPKNNLKQDSDQPTLTKLIGHSPDKADALVLALRALLHEEGAVEASVG